MPQQLPIWTIIPNSSRLGKQQITHAHGTTYVRLFWIPELYDTTKVGVAYNKLLIPKQSSCVYPSYAYIPLRLASIFLYI